MDLQLLYEYVLKIEIILDFFEHSLWKPFFTHNFSNLIGNRQSGNWDLLCHCQRPLESTAAEHQEVCLDLRDLWGFC